MIRIIDCSDELINRTAAAAFDELKLAGNAAAEILKTDEEEIREINRLQRGIDKSTDVLSFPLLDRVEPFTKENYPFDFDADTGEVLLGSIVICEQAVENQAKEYGHGKDREYAYLFLHGLLHLLGYDHIEEKDREKMREAEERILQRVGLTR